ncbi:MAG: cell division protein FtsZ [Bacteroidales bacterium]|nr:cell division protein FtsZ [Bacteroidales bacterium]
MNLEEIIDASTELKSTAKIRVIGVGGAGCNAVEYMKFGHRHNAKMSADTVLPPDLEGVDYWVCNTDYKHIQAIPIDNKIQLGPRLTNGLGAGSKPEAGRAAALESMEEIKSMLNGADMIFVTAGMGGGTGTGAAPVIAKTAKEMNILTIGVVNIPFIYEREQKLKVAYEGVKEMIDSVDALIVLNSECLKELYGKLALSKSFAKADAVLSDAVRGVSEIVAKTGSMNVDFADIRTFMQDSGVAFIGSGVASGENRALDAVKQALSSPIINNRDIRGSQHVIIFFQSAEDTDYEVTQDELSEVAEYINNLIDVTPGAGQGRLKFGSVDSPELEESIKVTIVATGFQENVLEPNAQQAPKPKSVKLDNEGAFVEQKDDSIDDSEGNTLTIEYTDSTKEILQRLYERKSTAVEEENKYDPSQLQKVTTLPIAELFKEETLLNLESQSALKRRKRN